MEVKLAGYNVDADELAGVCEHYHVDPKAPLTPETLSAAYARISRDPAPVGELREKARQDVVKARASNQEIVFGFGHASVAEHAVLNFDVTGLSRLAIEALEHSRLCSYTEKSQRYQKLKDDYVMPEELRPWEQEFHDLIALQNRTYQQAYKAIKKHLAQYAPGMDAVKRRGKAKEDARYLTSLAMEGQLGMTVNARNLETMVRRLAAHPLAEVRELAQHLHDEGTQVVPSLLRHTAAEPMRRDLPRTIARIGWPGTVEVHEADASQPDVVFLGGRNEALIATALMYETATVPHERCSVVVDKKRWIAVFKTVFEQMDVHSAAPRAFELADFTFELTVSASCFAQLKRHRMATIIPQSYEPSLGVTVPQSIRDAQLEGLLQGVAAVSNRLFHKIAKHAPTAAPYALIQAQRRRVLVHMNAREIYAFARLRMDGHAQWEIRAVAREMIRQLQQRTPVLMALACGKDEFEERKSKLMEAFDGPDPVVSIRNM